MARAHALPQFIIRATVFDMATNFSATFWLYAKGWLSFFAPLRTIGSTYKPLPTSAHPCHCAIANPLPAIGHPIASQCPPLPLPTHCQPVPTPLPASVHTIASHCQPVSTPLPTSASQCLPLPLHHCQPLPASAHPIASHCQPVPTLAIAPSPTHCQPVSTPVLASTHPCHYTIASQCQPVPTPLPASVHPCHCAIASQCPPHCQPLPASAHPCHCTIAYQPLQFARPTRECYQSSLHF